MPHDDAVRKAMMSLLEEYDPESMPWPDEGDDLLLAVDPHEQLEGGHFRDNAWIPPWSNGWEVRTQGYMAGARILANWVLHTHSYQDLLVFPVLFLFRHYMELRLKALVEMTRRLDDDDRPACASHLLGPLVGELEKSLPRLMGWDSESPDWLAVKRVALQLDELDPRAQAFRYSRDSKGRPIRLQKPDGGSDESVSNVNVRALNQLMAKVSNLLDGSTDAVSHALESRGYDY